MWHKAFICYVTAFAILVGSFAGAVDSPSKFTLKADDTPKLTLSAQSTMRVFPDELQINIGVVTLGTTAEGALEDNSRKVQAIIASLQNLGLARADYETGFFAIRPNYTPYPKDAPADWQPSISGYEVNNTVFIHTSQIDLAGKLIDAANRAGANSINDVHFGLHDAHPYWNEVIAKATSQAIDDAHAIAKAAGVHLGTILSITLDKTNIVTPHMNVAYTKMASFEGTPIEPGSVNLTASVTVVFEISQK